MKPVNKKVTNKRQQNLKFAEQAYYLRLVCLALAIIAVGACFHELHAPLWQWLLVSAHLLIWPQLSYFLARRAQAPQQQEYRNIVLDVSAAGFWIAMIHFDAVPSLTLFSTMCMTLSSAGGWRLLIRGLVGLALGCALGMLVGGASLHTHTSLNVLVFSIPLLVLYPMTLSAAIHRLARRVSMQNRMLNELSRTDGLTGLPNRQHWQEALNLEFQRFLRTHRPATLVMLDLDGFKQLNDTHGHPAGDQVLQRVANMLLENSRSIDTPGRFGGDELAMVMPETGRDGAYARMERLRRQIEREEFNDGDRVHVTISVGLAQIDRDMSDPLDWIKATDDALYQAKERGRNRVYGASSNAPPANNASPAAV